MKYDFNQDTKLLELFRPRQDFARNTFEYQPWIDCYYILRRSAVQNIVYSFHFYR